MKSKVGKNIVLCFDGTGNKFREHNTNVVKLYQVLQRNHEEQITFYDPGVGTLADPDFKTPIAKKINTLLGLAFGRGLIKNIEEAYSYLMEQYEDGNRIYLFGFSRGAYTARVLAGFIHSCGLLEKGCQNLIPYAMKLYDKKEPNFKILAKFKNTYGRNCEIHFLGLWDTVSTFGWIYNPIFLPFTTNNPSVKTVRHALAIDERRTFFRQMHWGDKHLDRQDVKEVWFAGVHSDVGGGYPEEESGLAKIALKWMLDEASENELLIDPAKYEKYVLGSNQNGYVGPNATGPIHESLKGPWKVLQYLPQRDWDPIAEKKVFRFPKQIRPIKKEATLHYTVLERLQDSDYEPLALNTEKRNPYPSIREIRQRFELEVESKTNNEMEVVEA